MINITLTLIVLAVMLFAILVISSVMSNVFALQQVAGKIDILVNPGETNSFKWGLLSDIDEASELGITAEGSGSEFLSFPKTVALEPKELIYVTVNVTIPQEHPGGVTLAPVMAATQFGKAEGQTVINIQMRKNVTITIGPNENSDTRLPSIQSFPQTVRIGQNETTLVIQSSSEIMDFGFSEERKEISFNVSGLAGTNGTATVQVGNVLEGPYNVMLDNSPVDFELIRNETSTETSIKIEYSHSVHTITITGTNVVPEFPISTIGLVVALGSLAAILRASSLNGIFRARNDPI